MSMFRHYQTDIDYKKLIEMQASQPAPFSNAKDFRKGPKKEAKASSVRTKTLVKRRSAK